MISLLKTTVIFLAILAAIGGALLLFCWTLTTIIYDLPIAIWLVAAVLGAMLIGGLWSLAKHIKDKLL
jgi:hypothetical protein